MSKFVDSFKINAYLHFIYIVETKRCEIYENSKSLSTE